MSKKWPTLFRLSGKAIVNSTPPEVIERLNSLFTEEEPVLNLYKYSEGEELSLKNRKIHPKNWTRLEPFSAKTWVWKQRHEGQQMSTRYSIGGNQMWITRFHHLPNSLSSFTNVLFHSEQEEITHPCHCVVTSSHILIFSLLCPIKQGARRCKMIWWKIATIDFVANSFARSICKIENYVNHCIKIPPFTSPRLSLSRNLCGCCFFNSTHGYKSPQVL